MNKKLNKVLDEITKAEAKIAAWREHLEELYIRKNQLEDAEIIKSVRAMKLGSWEMLVFLENIQNGILPVRQGQTGMDAGQAEAEPEETEDYKAAGETGNNSGPDEAPAEREDREDEEKNGESN